jgi:mRNA interferase RelE/StbE
MKIVISPRAEKQLGKISKVSQIILAKKIRELGNITSAEPLTGYKNIFRIRVGDYRVVYKKTGEELYIVLIEHRKEIYKLLERWWR